MAVKNDTAADRNKKTNTVQNLTIRKRRKEGRQMEGANSSQAAAV